MYAWILFLLSGLNRWEIRWIGLAVFYHNQLIEGVSLDQGLSIAGYRWLRWGFPCRWRSFCCGRGEHRLRFWAQATPIGCAAECLRSGLTPFSGERFRVVCDRCARGARYSLHGVLALPPFFQWVAVPTHRFVVGNCSESSFVLALGSLTRSQCGTKCVIFIRFLQIRRLDSFFCICWEREKRSSLL